MSESRGFTSPPEHFILEDSYDLLKEKKRKGKWRASWKTLLSRRMALGTPFIEKPKLKDTIAGWGHGKKIQGLVGLGPIKQYLYKYCISDIVL